ncbi:MAG: hypothetical protein ACE5Z5_06835 [Candidatus Bathyarchaeia archaeon]
MSSGPDDPPVGLIMAQIMLPFLVVMVTGEVTVRGKENLFIYRKTPFGVGRYVKAMLLKGWLMTVPIAGAVTAVITILGSQTTFISLLTNTGLMMLMVAANVAFVLGLFLVNPAFSAKSIKLFLNRMIAMFVSIGLFMVSLLVLTGSRSEPIGGLLGVLLFQTPLSWIVGVVFLSLGKRNLSRIE